MIREHITIAERFKFGCPIDFNSNRENKARK